MRRREEQIPIRKPAEPFILPPALWHFAFTSYRRRRWRHVRVAFPENERGRAYWRDALELEGSVCLFLYLCSYSSVVNTIMSRLTNGHWALALLLIPFAGAPPLLLLLAARGFCSTNRRDEAAKAGGLASVNLSLVSSFKPGCWWFKAWLLGETAVFSAATMIPQSAHTRFILGMFVCAFFLIVVLVVRPYKERLEVCTDAIARINLFVLLAVGYAMLEGGVREGDLIYLPSVLHNLDPACFDDPEKVDFDRGLSPVRHTTMGVGPHRCVGDAAAARGGRP